MVQTALPPGAELSRRCRLWTATVEPMAGLVYAKLWPDSFAESGTS
jgi:hypothetical protein